MNKVKKLLNPKSISVIIFILIFIIINIILDIIIEVEANSLYEQNITSNWSEDDPTMQVSVFFTKGSLLNTEKIKQFEYTINQKINTTEGIRNWTSSYSAESTGTVTYGKNSENLITVGVGGDYFLFHPFQILEGSCFTNYNSDTAHDYCVIDSEAAWRLFGSTDVVGKIVELNGEYFFITGVVETISSRIYDQAGYKSGRIYISIDRYCKINKSESLYINEYEIILPEPAAGYAKNMVEDNMLVSTDNVEIIENTNRFTKIKILNHIGKLSTRAVVNKPLVYPYWENVARMKEDYLAGIMIGFFFLGISLEIVIIRRG